MAAWIDRYRERKINTILKGRGSFKLTPEQKRSMGIETGLAVPHVCRVYRFENGNVHYVLKILASTRTYVSRGVIGVGKIDRDPSLSLLLLMSVLVGCKYVLLRLLKRVGVA